jgi:hypothetical protein
MIFLDPTVQNDSKFHDSRILTKVFWPLHLASPWNAKILPRVSWWTIQMMLGFHDFTGRDFSYVLQRTKPHAPSCSSNDCRSSVQDLTAEMLSPFPCSSRPFWTGFPLWIHSQDESYGLSGCSLHMRRVLYSCGRKIRESFKDLREIHGFFKSWCCLLQSLTDLSNFQNALNDDAFCSNLSWIWMNSSSSSNVPASCISSSWIFDDSLKIEQESLLFLPS